MQSPCGIDRDERAIRTGTAFMDFPRDQLLPSASLSADQHRRGSRPHAPDQREDLLHRRRSSNQISEYAAKTEVALQLFGLLQTSLVTNRTFQKNPESVRFHRSE